MCRFVLSVVLTLALTLRDYKYMGLTRIPYAV